MAQVSRATVERVLRAAEGDSTVLKEIADDLGCTLAQLSIAAIQSVR